MMLLHVFDLVDLLMRAEKISAFAPGHSTLKRQGHQTTIRLPSRISTTRPYYYDQTAGSFHRSDGIFPDK
jgi:hypothetical protein